MKHADLTVAVGREAIAFCLMEDSSLTGFDFKMKAVINPSLFLAIFLVAGFFPRLAEANSGLEVIGFSDSVRLRVDGRAVSLKAGSAGFSIPAGARATILSGDATLLAEGAIVNVDSGDSFMYVATDGPGQILVQSGEVVITPPNADPYRIASGEFAPLTGVPIQTPVASPVEKQPLPVAAPVIPTAPPTPVATAPKTPIEAPKEFDPLNSLAAGISKLSKFKRPKLNILVEIHPYYKLNQTYDSNMYLVPPDKADGTSTGGGVLGSWITTNNLGARVLVPFSKRSKLSLLYDAQIVNYGTQPKANNAFNQNIRGDFVHIGRRGTKWKMWDHFINTEDPAYSELVARERRFQNTAGFEYDYARSRRLFIRPRVTHVTHKYLSTSLAASLNRYESEAGADIGLRVKSKTRVFVSYSRQIIHYSAGRTAHSKSHNTSLGAEGKLASRLTGRVNAGMRFRKYDIPLTLGARNINTLTTAVNLTYKPGRRFVSRFALSRAMTETTFAINRYYVANRVSLGFTHTFRKLSLAMDGSFQTDRYPETTTIGNVSKNRRDDTYTGTLRGDYKLRPWLKMGLSYTRAQRHSVFVDSFNYDDDKSALSVEMSF